MVGVKTDPLCGGQDCFPEHIYKRLQEAADDTINQDLNVFLKMNICWTSL